MLVSGGPWCPLVLPDTFVSEGMPPSTLQQAPGPDTLWTGEFGMQPPLTSSATTELLQLPTDPYL